MIRPFDGHIFGKKARNGFALIGCIQMTHILHLLLVVGKYVCRYYFKRFSFKTVFIYSFGISCNLYILLNRYIIPGKFIPCLYETALNTNHVIYEDVFVTGIVAQNCGFKV